MTGHKSDCNLAKTDNTSEQIVALVSRSIAENHGFDYGISALLCLKDNLSKQIKNIKHKLEAAEIIMRVKKDDNSTELYKHLKNVFKESIESSVREQDAKYLKKATNKSKAIWEVIISKIKHNSTKDENKSTLSPDDLNEFLLNICKKISQQVNFTSKTQSRKYLRGARNNLDTMLSLNVSPMEVKKKLIN
ncbi:hypothetical protein HHI36_000387 [Cryptolaemus montrouzieri]|uniref:Uncharacterized protein n=1 Tax=Cryptolaemus montrouzieri TaxID=559131 RepID=A0ABD2P570_9CUCU